MDGIILYADDHIFDSERYENELFQVFNSGRDFVTIPIDNLEILEKTVSSISTFRALILDWNFKRQKGGDSEFEEIALPDETPLTFLRTKKIYSLVYIYSQEEIASEIKEELESYYPGKIYFETKDSIRGPELEYIKIAAGIRAFEENNQHLIVPFIWSQSINQSAQSIFSELEKADPNWIKEIYKTALNDGAEPNAEVIGIFQNLLNESIIQNELLIKSVSTSIESPDIPVEKKEMSLAKLYNRIYYTRITESAPLMTGDIFKFSEEEFAILITPECDLNTKRDSSLEFLKFKKEDFEFFLGESREYHKKNFSDLYKTGIVRDADGKTIKSLKSKLKVLDQDFNNGQLKIHILPSFPFDEELFNQSAIIHFDSAFIIKTKPEFDNCRIKFKLNSPYIYQLRQRYLAFMGRVGVPAIPFSLRLFNLQ
jgi:hypothetical protein